MAKAQQLDADSRRSLCRAIGASFRVCGLLRAGRALSAGFHFADDGDSRSGPLWMMDHIMNNKLSLEFGESYARIPIKVSPHIRPADALEMEWSDLIAPERCSYILGNPPFGGSKYQSPKQRQQVRRVAQLGGSGGTLDYVTAWFLKAGAYLGTSRARIGFVATSSITQGEQVAQLWPVLFERYGLEISFAHRTFAWGSDAR